MRVVPTLLLCAARSGSHIDAFRHAARRARVDLRVATTADDRRVRPDGGPIDGVLAADAQGAVLAAQVAETHGLPWHRPDGVRVATDRLLSRGRLLAAGLPVPWFVGVPAHGDDDLERLTRVRFPCRVAPAAVWGGQPVRVASWDALMDARAQNGDRAEGVGDTLIVEAIAPGRAFELLGVLEQGALRVFALFEGFGVDGRSAEVSTADVEAAIHVTPAPLKPARQHVVAGHIARAALTLGLHHGPIHAACRVDDDDIVVLDVWPVAGDGALAQAIPVVDPDGVRCGLEDVLVAHALGRPLDGYGHQGIARGVLTVGLPDDAEAPTRMAIVGTMPHVTDAVVTGTTCVVYAEAARPEDVVATLRGVARHIGAAGQLVARQDEAGV